MSALVDRHQAFADTRERHQTLSIISHKVVEKSFIWKLNAFQGNICQVVLSKRRYQILFSTCATLLSVVPSLTLKVNKSVLE